MKKFKYLYFSNIISNSPLYKLWLFKKIKGGEEDDGNLLTVPYDFEDNGIIWSWNKFSVRGVGTATGISSLMCDRMPLKSTLVGGHKYTLSIKGTSPNTIRANFYLGGTRKYYTIFNSTTIFTLPASANGVEKFDFRLSDTRGNIDITLEDFKLIEVIE